MNSKLGHEWTSTVTTLSTQGALATLHMAQPPGIGQSFPSLGQQGQVGQECPWLQSGHPGQEGSCCFGFSLPGLASPNEPAFFAQCLHVVRGVSGLAPCCTADLGAVRKEAQMAKATLRWVFASKYAINVNTATRRRLRRDIRPIPHLTTGLYLLRQT